MNPAIIALVLFILFNPLSTVNSASVYLNSSKSVISSADEEFPVDVSLSINASDNTIYFLRGVFYKPGTSNYCGYTWNKSVWFNGPYTTNEGWKNFLQISTLSNSWSGELKAKLDPESASCKDYGEYNFKVQRFTAGSGAGTFDSQTPLSVIFTTPIATLTPTGPQTPTVTPEPTNTPIPTGTFTPTPTATITPSPTPSPTPANTPTATPTNTPVSTPTLTITPIQLPTSTITPTPTKIQNPPPNHDPKIWETFWGNVKHKTPICHLSFRQIKWHLGNFIIPRVYCSQGFF